MVGMIHQDEQQQSTSPSSSKTSSSSNSSSSLLSSIGISRSTCIFVLGIWVGICSTTLFGASLSRTLFGPSLDLRCYTPTVTYATTTTSSSASACHNADRDGNDGWTSIDVYYGNSSQLHVIPPKKGSSSIPWRSQAGQDKIIHKYITEAESGSNNSITDDKHNHNYYFVDLAANDATFLSNTYTLETYFGWNGLCIEANPKYWSRLAYRKCQVVGAVVGGNTLGHEVDFTFGPSNAQQVKHFDERWSRKWDKGTLGGIVSDEFDNKPNDDTKFNKLESESSQQGRVIAKRYTVPLKYIFERYNVPKIIDYLSLDVEGAEYYIMKDFPFDTYSFRVLSIERPNEELRTILMNNGYELLSTVGHNRGLGDTIWAKKKQQEIE